MAVGDDRLREPWRTRWTIERRCLDEIGVLETLLARQTQVRVVLQKISYALDQIDRY